MKRRAFFGSTMAAATAAVAREHSVAGLYRLVVQDPGELLAVRGDGAKVTLKGSAIKGLATTLRGRLLLAKSAGYEEARRVLNPTIDKHPALIAQPANAADVQAALR